jgi:hypothetical protein
MAQNTMEDLDDVEIVPLALPLDRATVSWLIRMTGGDDGRAAELIASMIRGIREDDETTHRVLH